MYPKVFCIIFHIDNHGTRVQSHPSPMFCFMQDASITQSGASRLSIGSLVCSEQHVDKGAHIANADMAVLVHIGTNLTGIVAAAQQQIN